MDDNGAVRPVSDGRAEHGRFGPSNRFGKGNPYAKKMAFLRATMLKSVDQGTIKRATRALGELAAGGDVQAIKLLYEYCIGKPPQAIELSGPDGSPIGLDWARVESSIFAALAEFPQARYAVAIRLRGLIDDAGRAEPTGHDA